MYGSQGSAPQPPPAEPHYSGKRWRSFLIGNVVALILCLAIFFLFMYGDFLSSPAEGLMRSLFDVPIVVVLIASLPLLVTILIGVAYAKKAMRRRRAEREALLRAAAAIEDPKPNG